MTAFHADTLTALKEAQAQRIRMRESAEFVNALPEVARHAAVVADLERLITMAQAVNAAEAAGLPAVLAIDARIITAPVLATSPLAAAFGAATKPYDHHDIFADAFAPDTATEAAL